MKFTKKIFPVLSETALLFISAISFSSCTHKVEYVEPAPSLYCTWEDTDSAFPAIYDITEDSFLISVYMETFSTEVQIKSELSVNTSASTIQLTDFNFSSDDGKTWEKVTSASAAGLLLTANGFNSSSTSFEYSISSNYLKLTGTSKTRTLKYRPIFNSWNQDLNTYTQFTYHFNTNHTIYMSLNSTSTTLLILKGKFTVTDKNISITNIKYYGEEGWDALSAKETVMLKMYNINPTETNYTYKVKKGKLFLTLDGATEESKLLPVKERDIESYTWNYTSFNGDDTLELTFNSNGTASFKAKTKNLAEETSYSAKYEISVVNASENQITLSEVSVLIPDEESGTTSAVLLNDSETYKESLVSSFGITPDTTTFDYFIFNNKLTLNTYCTYDSDNEKAVNLCFE